MSISENLDHVLQIKVTTQEWDLFSRISADSGQPRAVIARMLLREALDIRMGARSVSATADRGIR